MIQVQLVETKEDWQRFIDLPWKVYRDDPNWVPPLKLAVREILDINKNPFFKHASMRPMIAMQGNECVGRVVGVIDEVHNRFHEEKVVFFGFFESVKDAKVANALLDEVAKWGKSKGMNIVRGPVNPSTNHECGLLVEGFDDPPSVMMTYNPRYYPEFFENWGLAKAKDLLAYNVASNSRFSERLLAQAERLKQKSSVVFRPVRMGEFDQEIDRILEIYNDAWEKNWGFVPMAPEEFRHMAKEMKMIMDPSLCLIAEIRGEPVAFGLALPDVNQAIKKVKDGKLFPLGLPKLLWNLKGPGRKKTINRCRVLTLGIRRSYQEYGLGPVFYTEYLKRCGGAGYKYGEASWILEDNKPMNKALTLMTGERSKVYRIYDRTLSAPEKSI